jgi:acyl-coenzyme A synthetase/AMP-(fatty) acid ligase
VSATPLVNPFLHLQHNADRNPRGVFVRTPEVTLTNAEAVVEVKKLAFELRRLGVAARDLVALDLPDRLSILFTEAIYHEAAIGLVLPREYVADGRLPVRWIFSSGTAQAIPGATVITVDLPFLQRVDQNPYGISPSDAPIDILRIVFSSGTTGTPKAIALSREMELLMDAAVSTWFQAGPNLTTMDTGTAPGIGELFLSVKAGHPFLSVGGATPAAMTKLIADESVRTLKGSLAQVVELIEHVESAGQSLQTIDVVQVIGTSVPPAIAARLRALTGGCRIISTYGSTEAGAATFRAYDSDDPFDAGPIAPGATVEIVDDQDVPVPQGEIGRIRYRSFGMARGYYGDPEATALGFKDGWFYPGDLGSIRADGGLTVAGRESEILNAGGVKVDPNRLDHLALEHELVRDAASFTYESASGVPQIGLALVTDDGVDVQALIDSLKAAFGHAAPTLVARVDEIPRTASGKPLRRALAERYAGS